VEYKK